MNQSRTIVRRLKNGPGRGAAQLITLYSIIKLI